MDGVVIDDSAASSGLGNPIKGWPVILPHSGGRSDLKAFEYVADDAGVPAPRNRAARCGAP